MSARYSTLKHSITEVIGHTPLVELHRILRLHNLRGRLLAKLDYLNPGLSKKDRIALEIIQQAKAARQLIDGQTVIELTSGNTGTGLAIVCRALGHPFIAVMSKGNSLERARMMEALGAQVVLVDQAPNSIPHQVSGQDLALVEEKTRQLVTQHRAFRANQFEAAANTQAHLKTTGPELWEQSSHTLDVFLDFAGTAGTFTGVSRYLKSVNPKIRCYLVEPASAPVLAGKPVTNPNHKIQGGGYSRNPLPIFDPSLLTDYLQITDDQAIASARQLAAEEGIFAGFSSGAHLAAAISLLQTREPGATIAFLICDSGLKYLSTDLFPQHGTPS